MGQAKRHALQLDADFPGRPAGEVAATLVAAQQAVFRKAWEHYRQAAEDDPEALHDLRVELRRLRVWLTLSRDVIETRKSTRRRLKALAHASSPARDREVMLDLLGLAAQDATAGPVAERLMALTAVRQPADAERLVFDVKPGLKPRPRKDTAPFAEWFGEQLKRMTAAMDQELSRGVEGAHTARIQIKHLRYLVEPMSEPFSEAAPMIKDFKAAQDHLGDLHDLMVFRSRIPTYAGWLIAEDLPPVLQRPGKQSRAVTRAFAGVRDGTLALSGWQDERFNTLWAQWSKRRPSIERRIGTASRKLAESMHAAAGASD
ncbi:CHAD domain-containing protein [Guyparkeria sp. 1SP6A2]|nr:CHAD domain-containing protein [Guyparkeria sp. 1SP6A2]